MLFRCVAIILLITSCLFSTGNAEESAKVQIISPSNTTKLYLTISNQDKVFNDLFERRFQRMLLREIISLGKHEFQIFDKKDLAAVAITGEILRITLRPATSSENIEIHLSLTRLQTGEKKSSLEHIIKVSKTQAFSSGISQIISILK